MATVFIVTAVERGLHGPSRSWGWFPSAREAAAALSANDGDMREETFEHAVVEEYEPGSPARQVSEAWFAWDAAAGGFVPSAKPVEARNVTHFGLG